MYEQSLKEIGHRFRAHFVVLHLHAPIKVRILRALRRLLRGERHNVHVAPYARSRKVVGLLLPEKWIPGLRDKPELNIGRVIRLDATDFGNLRAETVAAILTNISHHEFN